ncbi:hypothetical protein HYV49_05890 [Candidatus Pacearchaeota archaeon]|nr:hypothetical protein [Candidatus Pacearchaeota archaeon]
MPSFDLIGNIALMKFKDESLDTKKRIALNLLEKHKNITTVLEKIEKIKGRLRTMKVRHIAGLKTTIATYKENGCIFRLDIAKCYFSPRLAEERKLLAFMIKHNENMLVMFSGIGIYPIIIQKLAHPQEITAIELGKIPHKYAMLNQELNKARNVKFIQGDVKKVIPKLAKQKIKFDRIVMPRPQLEETFLKEAFSVSKKGTIIHYYDFAQENEIDKIIQKIEKKANESKKKIRVVNIKKAGDIAPYRYRWRIDMQVS